MFGYWKNRALALKEDLKSVRASWARDYRRLVTAMDERNALNSKLSEVRRQIESLRLDRDDWQRAAGDAWKETDRLTKELEAAQEQSKALGVRLMSVDPRLAFQQLRANVAENKERETANKLESLRSVVSEEVVDIRLCLNAMEDAARGVLQGEGR
jgi:chromosome segregation ATPase